MIFSLIAADFSDDRFNELILKLYFAVPRILGTDVEPH